MLGATRADLDRAAALDIELIAITTPCRLAGCAIGPDPAVFVHDLRDPVVSPIVAAIHAQRPVLACLAACAAALEPAAALNDALDLPWLSARTVRLSRSRTFLTEAGIRSIAGQICRTPAELVTFGYSVGFPVVIKPESGTRLLHVPEQAAALTFPVLVEEYLRGPQYSVESFTFHGQHVPVAVTEQTTFGRDLGWFIPIARATPGPAEVLTATWDRVRAALTALGITEGPAHTDLIMSHGGAHILGVRPGPGPDRIPDLVHLSTGVDLDVLTLAWAAQATPRIAAPDVQCASAIHHLVAAPGRIANINGTHRARAHPGVVDVVISLAPGDNLRPMRTPADRPGHVLAIGPTRAGALVACTDALEHITLEYSGARLPSC